MGWGWVGSVVGNVVDTVTDAADDVVDTVNDAYDKTEQTISDGYDTAENLVKDTYDIAEDIVSTAYDWAENYYEWNKTNVYDYLSGKTSEEGYKLQQRSDQLQSESDSLTSTAEDARDEYNMQNLIYRNKGNFRVAMIADELRYLKYTYPAKSKELQERIDALNADVKKYQDKYGSGFMGANDYLGTYAGGMLTSVAMLVGNIEGYIRGREGSSFQDALKSFVALVILYFVITAGPEITAEVIGTLGLEVTYVGFYVTMAVVTLITLDSMFGGSRGMINVLDTFGQMFEALGLTGGSNIFSKFFDSFNKDSDYNAYLVFAVQLTMTMMMMPNFDTMLGKELAMAMTVYNGVNAVDSTIQARKEYEAQKAEYEKKLEDSKKEAISTERNARLAKLSASYSEGDSLADYTFFQQFASGKQWMSYKRNGLFYSTKDSPDDIMFQYDLMSLLNPNPKTLGVS